MQHDETFDEIARAFEKEVFREVKRNRKLPEALFVAKGRRFIREFMLEHPDCDEAMLTKIFDGWQAKIAAIKAERAAIKAERAAIDAKIAASDAKIAYCEAQIAYCEARDAACVEVNAEYVVDAEFGAELAVIKAELDTVDDPDAPGVDHAAIKSRLAPIAAKLAALKAKAPEAHARTKRAVMKQKRTAAA